MANTLGKCARVLSLVVAVVFLSSLPVCAENYVGKLDLVQVTSSNVRFLVQAQGLSLFATGDFKNVLLEGFFRKSNFSIGYAPSACPAGITGKCGTVNFVSVHQSNF